MIQIEVSFIAANSRLKLTLQEFLPTIPVDTSSLALWLHECTPKFVEDVEQATEAYEDLCRADIMRADDDIVSPPPSRSLADR